MEQLPQLWPPKVIIIIFSYIFSQEKDGTFIFWKISQILIYIFKGIVLAGFAKGAALGSLVNTLNSAASDETTYAQRFYNRNSRDVFRY